MKLTWNDKTTLRTKNKMREHGGGRETTVTLISRSPSTVCFNGRAGLLVRMPDGDERWIPTEEVELG